MLGGHPALPAARPLPLANWPHSRHYIWIRGGQWPADIPPTDSGGDNAGEARWASYREFVLYYAKFAARHDVETLVAGVELKSAFDVLQTRDLRIWDSDAEEFVEDV